MSMSEYVTVPFNGPTFDITIVSLLKSKLPGNFAYLQGVRSGALVASAPGGDQERSAAAVEYRALEKIYCSHLAARMPADFDAILSPPSDHPSHAEPYRLMIREKKEAALDVTGSFERVGPTRAGLGGTPQQLLASMTYFPCGAESSWMHIVIVDDIMKQGTTVAAIIMLLRQHGLSPNCKVTVACPLWLT